MDAMLFQLRLAPTDNDDEDDDDDDDDVDDEVDAMLSFLEIEYVVDPSE